MIEALVSDLPEIYQPIHGHPELSGRVSRSCADRLEQIAHIHDALRRLLGRPLKVLDLGCAQGFFSLNLAERGAAVHGVDYLDKNIAVCNALARENPGLRVDFETGRVEEIIARLQPGQYDLVLGLSVFHHIVHEKGADVVKAMLERAAEQSGALLVELALREEPLYWAPAQPADPRELLGNIAFVHEVARYETHLAAIPRPLFVASNRLWVFADQASQFDHWSLESHDLAQGAYQGSRRYFFSTQSILKLYRFDHPLGEINKRDYTRAVDFLKSPPSGFSSPSLYAYGENKTNAWLVIQRLPGRLLNEILHHGTQVDARAVLIAVLDELAALEAAGLYHDDVRTWNVLVAEDGATHLIDYDSISMNARDCVWPGNLFLSFLIFVREVVTGVVDDPVPLRTVSISPYSLPQPYCNWAMALWQRPVNEWSFRLLRDSLMETSAEAIETPLLDANGAWMNAIEEAVQTQKQYSSQVYRQVKDLAAKEVSAESRAQVAEAQAARAVAESQVQQEFARAMRAEERANLAEGRAQLETARAVQAEERANLAEARAARAESREADARTQAESLKSEALAFKHAAEQAQGRSIEIEHAASVSIAKIQTEAEMAASRANAAEAQTTTLQATLQQIRDELNQTQASNLHHYDLWLQSQKQIQTLAHTGAAHQHLAELRHHEVRALKNSLSWRVTAPLRWLAQPLMQASPKAPPARVLPVLPSPKAPAMRIVIDMQGAQTESRFRGIGRYTLAFAQAVARNRGQHEVFIALSGLFPETIEPIRTAFEGLLPQENIRVWHAPGPVREEDPANQSRREAAELLREAFLASLQPDVIHVCSLFEGYVDDAVTSIGRFDTHTPVSVTLHDLIPLLNPDQYLKPNPRYENYYSRKTAHLKRGQVYLAVSESSLREGVTYAGVPESRVVNTSEAVEARFCPLDLDPSTRDTLLRKFGLTHPFVLYTGGADERKNLPRLIQAYAALPTQLRARHQLVLAGKMPQGNIAQLEQIARSAGIMPGELVFTGYVSDEELVQLYNLCKLYVFPSWHEGFGLPALEAMACGAPVIGANTTSLPEVIDLDSALFDPLDTLAIAAKIEKALTSKLFRGRLRRHGLQQARRFSWDETARRAIGGWESLCVDKDSGKQIDRALSTSLERLDALTRQVIDKIANLPAQGYALTDSDLRIMPACAERNQREIEAGIRSRLLPETIVWRMEGPFDSSYSLALVNRETARAMANLGHTVVLHSTEGPGDFPANEQFLEQNPDLAELYRRAARVPQGESDVTSRNLYPPRVADMACRLNLLHGYGWEESGFPQEWVSAFNQNLQGMTVVSEYVRKIMIDNGVTVPIAVTGNGVDHWERITPDRNASIQARTFRFLHVSSCFPRKGIDRMLEAYGRAFSIRDDVTLVIKTFQNPHNEIHRWLEEARAAKPDFPDVLILEGDYSDAQLKGLYEQCQALVGPSRAEGFGLPMAEAMLSGLAVITTGWSGQLDFCTHETAWLVDYRFEWAKTHFSLFSSVWADPDVGHLANTLRQVFETSAAERKSRIDAGRKLLLEQYRWSHVAVRMVGAARQWSRVENRPEPRIGWVTTWNTRCGIAAYSEHLIRNMPVEVTVLAPQANELTANDQNHVTRCWSMGETDSLQDLGIAIEQAGNDTLVIQFNYGFFKLETLADFLSGQIDAGRVVVVMLHATIDPVHAAHKKLRSLVPALARCHRLLVHSPNDMNRLKEHGLVHNVTLFPHGILDFDPPAKLVPVEGDRFILASYGFFLPHKGLLELIEAVARLRDQKMPVELRMINSEYPAAESGQLIKQARQLIEEKRLEEVVTLCTDYLDDRDSLDRLAGADLIVFPYQNTGESSSAAVRYGIASGRPVAVTPLAIFDDVADAVLYLDGQTPEQMAASLMKLKNRLAENGMARKSTSWRAQHLYSSVGKRLFNLLCGIRRAGGM